MMGVGGVTVTDDLAINFRAALLRVLQFLQSQHARTLAHDKAVALLVERSRRSFRIIVARAHGAHRAEAADADGHNRGFATAGKHHYRFAHLDGAPGFADGVIGSGTGGTGGSGSLNLTGTTGVPAMDQSIAAAYPGATITSANIEDDGRGEIKIRTASGQSITVKLNSAGQITGTG